MGQFYAWDFGENGSPPEDRPVKEGIKVTQKSVIEDLTNCHGRKIAMETITRLKKITKKHLIQYCEENNIEIDEGPVMIAQGEYYWYSYVRDNPPAPPAVT